MNIVLDTNVLVAGLLSPFGACGDIVRMISSGNLTLCVDARILSEYHEALRRPKFQFPMGIVAMAPVPSLVARVAGCSVVVVTEAHPVLGCSMCTP